MRAIIIGGGIGGFTVAIALRAVGIDAQVYERASSLGEVGAGIALGDNALRIMETLGLGNALRSQSVRRISGSIMNPEGKGLFAVPGDEVTRQLGAVAVLLRAELMALLAQVIDPGHIHLGWTCVGFEQDDTGVTAVFENGETAKGDLLIGADGLKSVVRTELFGEQQLLYAGYTAWRAVVASDCNRDVMMGETWGRGCRFGILPMSLGRVYWFATSNSPEGERDPEGKSRQTLSRLFLGWHKPIEALINTTNEGSILRNDIYDMNPIQRWVRGRVALLGDAAHPMTPNLGQGACQAIEDAVVLAACLRGSESIEVFRFSVKWRRGAPR